MRPRGAKLLLTMLDVQRGDGFEKGNQKRVIHELINDAAGVVENRRMGGNRVIMGHEKAIADTRGDVDLTRSARDNVHLHELLPKGREAGVGGGDGFSLGGEILVEVGVALSIESEFKRLHAVVLR